jgi:hypothetical protein
MSKIIESIEDGSIVSVMFDGGMWHDGTVCKVHRLDKKGSYIVCDVVYSDGQKEDSLILKESEHGSEWVLCVDSDTCSDGEVDDSVASDDSCDSDYIPEEEYGSSNIVIVKNDDHSILKEIRKTNTLLRIMLVTNLLYMYPYLVMLYEEFVYSDWFAMTKTNLWKLWVRD